MSDQSGPEQCLCMLAYLFGAAGQADAPSLTAASGVYLRLDDPELAAECVSRGDRLCGRRSDAAFGHGNAELGEQSLGLVFVKIQAGSPE